MYFNLEICLYLTETLRGVDWWWLVVRAPLLLISAPVRCAVVEAVDEASLEVIESVGWQNFGKMLLVFGCIGSDFCKKICVLQHFSKSTRFSS